MISCICHLDAGAADYSCHAGVCSFLGLPLGSFNLDVRQAASFIGMPTPANARFGYAWFRKLLYSGAI
ncbi:MAG: hypothetical protein ACLU30_19640 [Odoribacter splanchnicus]